LLNFAFAFGRQLPCSFFFLPGTAVYPGQHLDFFEEVFVAMHGWMPCSCDGGALTKSKFRSNKKNAPF
jgi:hypothetical protein